MLLESGGPFRYNSSAPADMAELADALDLGSSGATRAGSIPVIRTKQSLLVENLLPTGFSYLGKSSKAVYENMYFA